MAWIEREGKLVREVRTADFLSAFQIVERLVAPAEAANHHPDIEFGWGYVRIALTTHDKGGITQADHDLAAEMDRVLG